MLATELQYIQLRDFSAGIQTNPCQTHPSLIPAPPGTANPLNTFRCRALPFGGLGPLPSLHHSISIAGPGISTPDGMFHITSFHITNPIVQDVVPVVYTSSFYYPFDPDNEAIDPFYFLVAVDYTENVAGNFRRRTILYRIDPVENSLVLLHNQLSATNGALDIYAGSSLASMRSVGDTSVGGARVATDTGSPVIVYGYQTFFPGECEDLVMYPNPSTAATEKTDATLQIIATISNRVIAHQTRVLTAVRNAYSFGVAESIQDGATFSFTKPNEIDNELSGATYFEGANSVGAWGSMTASDLFIVSTREGGLLIQGDLNAATVRKLPSVTPTYGIETNGAATPIGFAYGTNHQGVHVWQGGSGSIPISPNLPGDFFFSPSLAKSPISKGQFAHWGEWLLTPYNWAYHYDTKSWWRIEDPTVVDIAYWFASPFGKSAYGCTGQYSSAVGNHPIIHAFAVDNLAPTYKWQSQIITVDSINRLTRIRELNLLADGPGTITITITTLSGTSTPVTFTLNNSGPELQSSSEIALDVSGGMVVTIEADSGSTAPAPLMLDLSIGHASQSRVVA